MKLFLKKTGKAFWPCDTMGEDFMANAKDGYWECKKISERSYRQLSKFFATVSDIYKATDASEVFANTEEFRSALLIAAGWKRKVALLDGTWHFEARSISYADVDHDKFQPIFDKAIKAACDEYDLVYEEIV